MVNINILHNMSTNQNFATNCCFDFCPLIWFDAGTCLSGERVIWPVSAMCPLFMIIWHIQLMLFLFFMIKGWEIWKQFWQLSSRMEGWAQWELQEWSDVERDHWCCQQIWERDYSYGNGLLLIQQDLQLLHAPSYQIIGDNLDMLIKVKHMSSTNQNNNIHWFNLNAVKNRVHGNHLPNDQPIKSVLDIENVDFFAITTR